MKLNSIFKEIKNIQNKLPERQLTEPMTFLMEEIGELSTEITIKMGIKDKIPGKDGINGEVVDSIICLMDILLMNNPNFNEDDFYSLILQKLNKWNSVYAERN